MEMVGRGKEGRGAMGLENRRLRCSLQGEEEDRREEMLMEAICGESEMIMFCREDILSRGLGFLWSRNYL